MAQAMHNLLTPILAALLLGPLGAFAVELSIEPSYPMQGKEARVTVTHEGQPVAGAAVTVTYRPNSEVLREAEVGVTDASGNLIWLPEDAGMAELRAEAPQGEATQAISVRFSGLQIPGLLVFALAGIILFGGNIIFVSRTLRARGNPTPRSEP